VLTHMVPSPATADEEEVFADEVRDGGFQGELVVGRDLMSVEI
jgi:ribonuclease Z